MTSIRTLCALGTLAVAVPLQAGFWDTEPSTVERIADNNGLDKNGYLRVRTTSILRVEPVDPVPADPRAAIQEYDRLLSLPQDAIPPSLRTEALRRAADLRLHLGDRDASSGKGFHVKEVRRAIAGYQRVLADYPDYRLNGRVLYQLARAHRLLNETDLAIDALVRLGVEYPHSRLAADANFRAAELLFGQRRFVEAAGRYEALLELGCNDACYDMARYKYGWSLYRQSQFEHAATVFLDILDESLPGGSLVQREQVLSDVPATRLERVQESLRVTALSFAAIGGGPSLSEYFEKQKKASRMEPLVFETLGQTLLELERYTDAAQAFFAYADRHPNAVVAPQFSQRAIESLRQGAFDTMVLEATAAYADRYAPDAGYWNKRDRQPEVLGRVRQYQDALGRYYQAIGQDATDPAERRNAYLTAASWYRRTLERFPDASDFASTSMLLADARLEGGEIRKAALQYEFTAYELSEHAQSQSAALAAVQSWEKMAAEAASDDVRDDALRSSIASSHRLASTWAKHPQRLQVLIAAAENEFALGDLEAAARSAGLALAAAPTDDFRIAALTIRGDAYFNLENFAEAETAYQKVFELPIPHDDQRVQLASRYAASIYRLGEQARDNGKLREAAERFFRVASLAPQAKVREASGFDAASVLFELEDWPAAVNALERFRALHPVHGLVPDVDKKLALAYQNADQPLNAAAVYQRISGRESEAFETRRLASWTAAELYQSAGDIARSLPAWKHYSQSFPSPLDPAMQAMEQIVAITRSDSESRQEHEQWLEKMISTDREAGAERTLLSRQIAAAASLEIGQMLADRARQIALRVPLEHSLAARKSATESAIRALNYAAEFGFEELTSAATYQTASLYSDFGRALLDSEAPPDLTALASEQYSLLLEEQAYPFEEKAINAHEINLSRVDQGAWNPDIGKSVAALAQLSPAAYAKQEKRETKYESLE